VVPTTEVVGELTTPPSGQADVGAAIPGRVVATGAGLPRPGQAVRRGQLLATIAPAPAAPEAAARADLAVVEAEARVQAARDSVQRAERLIADRAISQREVDEARRELGVAEESVQASRRARDVFSGAASGRGGGTYRVVAPIDGVIALVEATEGKSVQSGQLLFRVVNLDELWIRARVPEQQATLIRSDQNAAYKLPGLDAWLPLDVTGPDATASVIDVGRTVDRRSRTVDVIYALRASDERLRVGAMLRVAVPAGQPWEGVVVPRGAVLDADGRSTVYVQTEGEAFEERTVRVGPRSGARIGISSGVRAGERVVTVGANVIRLSSRAATAPAHGHVH
jgi:RND family efflux transporter MFP subunit